MSLSLLLGNASLRAASFIVTIYGDVVESRGGAIWVGNLIETCAEVGISETLVRTAASRLVSAGQLIGERQGRRSYYRLTEAAQTDFAAAARLLFGTADHPVWRFVYLGDLPSRPMRGLWNRLDTQGLVPACQLEHGRFRPCPPEPSPSMPRLPVPPPVSRNWQLNIGICRATTRLIANSLNGTVNFPRRWKGSDTQPDRASRRPSSSCPSIPDDRPA